MTALTTSYTCRNFSQRWPSCHLQNSNLLPFPLLVQLHLHFSQGLLFSLWWNSNGAKIIFSFASTCTKRQGNFQCCPKTEGQHRCSLRYGIHLKHSFLSFAIWANHQTIKKILLYSGILLCVKEFFLLWPTSILIRFSGKFYILAVLFIFVHSSWYSGLFFVSFLLFLSILQDFDYFCIF